MTQFLCMLSKVTVFAGVLAPAVHLIDLMPEKPSFPYPVAGSSGPCLFLSSSRAGRCFQWRSNLCVDDEVDVSTSFSVGRHPARGHPFCTLFVSSARTSRSGAATLVGAPPNNGGVMLHVAVGSHETVAAKQVCTTRRPRALQVCAVFFFFFDDLLGSHKPSCSHTPCLSNVCWQVRG